MQSFSDSSAAAIRAAENVPPDVAAVIRDVSERLHSANSAAAVDSAVQVLDLLLLRDDGTVR